jgi:hypothetical protein
MAVSDTRPPLHQYPALAKGHNGPLTALHPKLAHNSLPQPAPLDRRAGAAGEVNAPVVDQRIAHGPAEPPQHRPLPQSFLASKRDHCIDMPLEVGNERVPDDPRNAGRERFHRKRHPAYGGDHPNKLGEEP